MQSTLLSTLLTRMQRWSAVQKGSEEQYLVRDLDDAIRALKREYNWPWSLKKTTLRVFPNVLEYAVPSDYGALAILDNQETTYESKVRPYYTSVREFYEDPTNKSMLAEIFNNGTVYLGVKNKDLTGMSTVLNTAETVSQWSVSGDATAVALDSVFYKEGNGSMKVSVTSSTGVATITAANTSLSDSNYKKKYFFIWVYLDAAPTSVTLYFGNDIANNLYKTVTTQFDGQGFVADDWNLLAMDLNTASVTGTITSTAFDYQAITLTGAATGTYFVDTSYLRQWSLMDLWYYSTYYVKTSSSALANQEFFYDSSDTYSVDSSLVCDEDWTDVIVYDAVMSSLTDTENSKVLQIVAQRRQAAWDNLKQKYPDLEPQTVEHRWRFASHGDILETDYEQGS